MSRSPVKMQIRTYNVGFGDCFLLSFIYERGWDRHVLVDFGTMKSPDKNRTQTEVLTQVAQSIKDRVQSDNKRNRLDMLVATHRHKDHIGGFGLTEPNKIIESLRPKVVVQPWTENPKEEEEATSPGQNSNHIRGLMSMDKFSHAYFGMSEDKSLDRLSDEDLGYISHLKSVDEKQYDILKFRGADNVKNKKAVASLMKMGAKGRAKYMHAGQILSVKRELPGVQIKVLGPPTVDQYNRVRKQKHGNDPEFWNLMAASAPVAPDIAQSDPFKGYDAAQSDIPEELKWFTKRLKKITFDRLFRIVTKLDKALNNTSLILLFKVGDKSILFPGDAQIENWEYILKNKSLMNELKSVDVYKVGHHGSLNATPKSLWEAFEKKGDADREDRMISLLSTLSGKHGNEHRGTEVPRKTLVSELEHRTDLLNTEDLSDDELFLLTEIPLN